MSLLAAKIGKDLIFKVHEMRTKFRLIGLINTTDADVARFFVSTWLFHISNKRKQNFTLSL